MTELQALVVDDSALYRHFVRSALSSVPDIKVVGHASNGTLALKRIRQLRPHVVILDLHMPEQDGLAVLRELRGDPSPPAVLVLTSESDSSVAQTTEALAFGAFDFILKPTGADANANRTALAEALRPRLESIRLAAEEHTTADHKDVAARSLRPAGGATPEVVCIGVSTGGPASLKTLLGALDDAFPVPILIVQHMPPSFTTRLASDLSVASSIRVTEARDQELVLPGRAYIAPGGLQMKVAGTSSRRVIRVTDSPPENNCRPSANYLFRSVARSYGDAVLAVVMTGMGTDGTEGCRVIREVGGMVIAQDEGSCVVYGMPRSVVEAGLANEICSLGALAGRMGEIVTAGRPLCPH